MQFFSLPTEIRLKIYKELLVSPRPIVFVPAYDLQLPPLVQSDPVCLCPALLRVNKKVYMEAIPFLYSHNHFRFPNIFVPPRPFTDAATIAPIIRQIGSQASLIRNLCISFPKFQSDGQDSEISIWQPDIINLELIRDACTGITTLGLLILANNALALDSSPF